MLTKLFPNAILLYNVFINLTSNIISHYIKKQKREGKSNVAVTDPGLDVHKVLINTDALDVSQIDQTQSQWCNGIVSKLCHDDSTT